MGRGFEFPSSDTKYDEWLVSNYLERKIYSMPHGDKGVAKTALAQAFRGHFADDEEFKKREGMLQLLIYFSA